MPGGGGEAGLDDVRDGARDGPLLPIGVPNREADCDAGLEPDGEPRFSIMEQALLCAV
jgi:hypothetical protein